MDRGAWWATVHGVTRVGQDLATEPPPPPYKYMYIHKLAFPGGTLVKNPLASLGDARDSLSIPGSGRPPGVGNGKPLQYSCLENSTDRSLASYSPWGRNESNTTEQMNTHSHTHTHTHTHDTHTQLTPGIDPYKFTYV